MKSAPSILVVEDNPTTRKMLRLALVTEGYSVVEGPDARAALAAAEKNLPDLVLQDLILPDMDGLELLRRLRALPGGAELPILALSGFLSRLEEAQAGQGGFTAVLVKPIEPSRLLDAIRVYLPQPSAPAASLGEGRRLLIVDDDPVQLKLSRIHFSQLGFDVSVAGGASDALISARAKQPDVILSDVFMPGTDGFDLCLEVRRDPGLANVPLVLLSGQYGSSADEDLARRVGASALVLRTPDFANVAPAIIESLETRAPMAAEQPSDQLELTHARLVIHQLERQTASTMGLAQRCGIQAAELSLLSGVANALANKADPDLALRDVLAATLDAAGISKGALLLRDATGVLEVRQEIGFSEEERSKLQEFFGQRALLEEIVRNGGSVSIPSRAVPLEVSRDILAGVNERALQIVPLISDGRGVGAMIIGGTSRDVTSEDSVAFARAMGNQVVQSLELARSVARLTASEQRYRTLLESATDFIAVLTPDGIVREMNHRWVELTGLPQEQLIGRHVRDFAPQGKEEENVQHYNEAVAANAARTPPVEIARSDGTTAFIEFSSTNVDVGGERLVFAIGRDVTERQQAHSELRRERDRAQRYLDTAEVLMLATDVDGRITLINRKGCDLLGWTESELLGRDFVETCLPARLRSELRKKHEGVLRGDVSVVENAILTRSGEERLIEWHNSTQQDDSGNVVGTFSSGIDITERHRAEAQVRLQSAALNAAANAIMITDREGRIEWVNPAFSELTGYSAAEAACKNPRDLIRSDQHDQALYKELWDTILSGHVWRGEVINRRKDGSLYAEEQTITPLRDPQGAISHFIDVKQDVTERNRTQKEIREGALRSARAEQEFRSLFASNPLPMWIYDLATLRILEVNGSAVQRYGYERDEFLNMTIKDIRPSEDIERLLHNVNQPREPWQDAGNWRHRLKSGRVIDVDVTSHTITFAGQSAALVVAQDITERLRAEEEVRQRGQLSALSAAVGLALADSDTLAGALQRCVEALVTYLDASFARIWTLNESESVLELQASAGLYTHVNGPHGRVPVGQFKIGRIASTRQPHLTNDVVGDPDVSDPGWARREGMVAFAGHPLIVAGRVVGVIALFARYPLSDAIISALASVADHVALGIERHRGTEALRTTEERMRFALQSADVGIWDMDYTTGVLRWSDTIEAHYGLPTGTFGGTFDAFMECVHPADRAELLETVSTAMKAGADFSTQNRAIWPDGTVRWLRGAGRVLLGEHGEPRRAVGISLDVTERRTLEEQFHQAQKMEAVGRLAGGVAHDFNNLLSVILGLCELLMMDCEADDPRRTDITEIHKAGKRAAALTQQLLAFSRKQIIEPTLLDLNGVVEDMRAMLVRLIGEDVNVVLGLRSKLALVKADRGQIEQIVMNLAVNARDAMPHGGLLTIETANVELDEHYAKTHLSVKPGPYVALTVTDTGTGMTPEVQARLFEPFFTTKDLGKGTGLGMATVYGIVTQSNGSVGVYSEIGRGTAFKVYFPRADVTDKVVEAPVSVALPRTGTQTLLVVEDERGLRLLAKRLLERQGYTVLVAADADEARRVFEEHPDIDLLLTDVVMPGASGPELTRQLIEQRPALKVLYMSGYTEDAIMQHGVLKPGIAFLNKPFTSETLGAKVREALDRQ